MNAAFIFSRYAFVIVLIDTWWNVNFHMPLKKAGAAFVLIDTWWNVNLCIMQGEVIKETVLIDTWWNVNFKLII